MPTQAIFQQFDQLSSRVLKYSEITRILGEHRESWGLGQGTSTNDLIAFLKQRGKLKQLEFPFPYRNETRFTWGPVSLLSVLLTIKKDAYFTHYTAMRMHGLTEQVPKTIYLNHEQRPHATNAELRQDRIDSAFNRPPRVSQNVIEYGDVRICLINGMHTGQLGVIENEVTYDEATPVKVRLTSIERTLIDITVRPAYSGGVSEVLKAFRLAKDRFSVNRLSAMLTKIGYVYPYHQAIGFYLERSEYKKSALDLLRRFPMEFDFYLAHQLRETEYVKGWRLFVPKGFK